MLAEKKKKKSARDDFLWLMFAIFISVVEIILWLYIWQTIGGKEKQNWQWEIYIKQWYTVH